MAVDFLFCDTGLIENRIYFTRKKVFETGQTEKSSAFVSEETVFTDYYTRGFLLYEGS